MRDALSALIQGLLIALAVIYVLLAIPFRATSSRSS